jgi:NADPH2:quinone reductase
MKAIQIFAYGGPEVLKYGEVSTRTIQAGEVRVKAEAIGVGKPDVLVRKGIYRWQPPMPAIPGNELSGVVIEIAGNTCGDIKIGDRVLVSSRELTQRGGCYAEEIIVPAQSLFQLPDSISFVDAVTLPNYQLAGALLYESGIKVPKSLLVHGAAGGVAVAVIQLAQLDGITVIGTVSSNQKKIFSEAAGGKYIFNRNAEDIQQCVLEVTSGIGVDLVLDHVGGPEFSSNMSYLAPFGVLLSYNIMGGLPNDNLLGAMRALGSISPAVRCFTIHTLDAFPSVRRGLMHRAIDLAAEGRISPPAATIFQLSDAIEAHELLDSGNFLGKIVLIP